jgi:hypothetical protein
LANFHHGNHPPAGANLRQYIIVKEGGIDRVIAEDLDARLRIHIGNPGQGGAQNDLLPAEAVGKVIFNALDDLLKPF